MDEPNRATKSNLRVRFAALAATLSFLSLAEGFVAPTLSVLDRSQSFSGALGLQKGWFADENTNGRGNSDGSDEDLVTREMFQRDLLGDPQVRRKRKKKSQGYEPLDNRDHLPFAVKQITPDPYTKAEVKKQRQKQNDEGSRKSNGKRKRSDLDVQLTSSRLKLVQGDNDASTLLGEFPLDKSTTSGDIISLTNSESGRLHYYKVETARCQYKYAGGQRFVMVRKILEVKEVTRAWQEAQLEKQFQSELSAESEFNEDP